MAVGERRQVVGAAARLGAARKRRGGRRAAPRHLAARHDLRCRRVVGVVEIDRLRSPFPAASATAVATSTPHDEVLLVADATGLLHSGNDGKSFTRVLQEPGITALAVDTRNPQNAFAGTASGLLLRSDDGGVSWSR